MATYVNDLRLKEIATGDESGTWGTSTNTNLELIAEAFSFGTEAITTNADTHDTTIADGSTDPGRSIYLKYTGTLDSTCTITIGPNTVSKLWLIENGTSGSQDIIISQGSGANVTIPAGQVKAIYSDGAGSGAAMVDAFTNLNLGGTLGVTGVVTANAGVVVDNITIDGTEIDLSSGDLTLDSAGDIILDADGADILLKDAGTTFGELTNSSTDFVIKSTTSNKDILFKGNDAGSAITALTLDMSDAGTAIFNHDMKLADNSKLLLGDDLNGVIQVSSSSKNLKITNLTDDADIDIRSDDGSGGDAVYFRADGSTGAAKMFHLGSEKIATTSSGAEVTGTLAATLSTAAQPNITSLGTLTTLTVDDITINASSISDAGDLTIDSGGDISLDADDGQVILKDGGAAFGKFVQNSSNFHIVAAAQDKDIKFFGNDGGASVTAFTLDMSNAGRATFNDNVICNGVGIGLTPSTSPLEIKSSSVSATASGMLIQANGNTNTIISMGEKSTDGGRLHMFDGGVEKIAFYTDGTANHISAGNVGIGTSSPSELLEVSKSTDGATIRISSTQNDSSHSTTTPFGILEFHSSDSSGAGAGVRGSVKSMPASTTGGAADLVFSTANSTTHDVEMMRITDAGRVGIGTNSPDTIMEIRGADPVLTVRDSSTSSSDANSTLRLAESGASDALGVHYDIALDNLDLKFGYSNDGSAATERVRIDSSGRLGIGTSSPAESLHTSGNIRLGDSAPAELYTNSSELRLGVDKNDDNDTSNLTFYVNNSEKARIDKDGFFGIGTTAPDLEFHVMRSSSSASYNYASRYVAAFERNGACDVGIRSNSANASALSFSDEDDADVGRISYVHSDNSLRFTVNTAEAMRIDSGGNALFNRTGQIGTHRISVNFASGSSEKGIGINSSDAGATTHMTFLVEASAKGSISTDGSTTTYNTSSDARLKDVTGEARGLEVVNKLNPVSYNWKETGISDEGLIAQELEGIVPNAIVQDDDGYYQMDYSKLVTHLVKAVQEQQEQIESLTSEIAILKEK